MGKVKLQVVFTGQDLSSSNFLWVLKTWIRLCSKCFLVTLARFFYSFFFREMIDWFLDCACTCTLIFFSKGHTVIPALIILSEFDRSIKKRKETLSSLVKFLCRRVSNFAQLLHMKQHQ